MGSGVVCSKNCEEVGGGMSASKLSTGICPYCRSFQSELENCNGNSICSQFYNNEKSSLNTHPHICPRFIQSCSQLRQFSSWPVVRNVSSDLCRCAKTETNLRKPFIRSNQSSSNDGWRAFRLVLVGILVLLPTSTMSSPLHRRSQRSASPPTSSSSHIFVHHEKPMKWVNPCRIPQSMSTHSADFHLQSKPDDEESFQNIVTQARKAEVQALTFFSDFKRESFGDEQHDYKTLHYDWLSDVVQYVGKDLGERLSPERLNELVVEKDLKLMYRSLQKLAVGLEAIVVDQLTYGGNFYKHFHEAEFQLKFVLCELQIAMVERNIKYEDVTRDIMDKDSFSNIVSTTIRNIRDFAVFEDYLNTLEFIQFSFEHLRNKAIQSKQESME